MAICSKHESDATRWILSKMKNSSYLSRKEHVEFIAKDAIRLLTTVQCKFQKSCGKLLQNRD